MGAFATGAAKGNGHGPGTREPMKASSENGTKVPVAIEAMDTFASKETSSNENDTSTTCLIRTEVEVKTTVENGRTVITGLLEVRRTTNEALKKSGAKIKRYPKTDMGTGRHGPTLS